MLLFIKLLFFYPFLAPTNISASAPEEYKLRITYNIPDLLYFNGTETSNTSDTVTFRATCHTPGFAAVIGKFDLTLYRKKRSVYFKDQWG